MGNKHQVHSYVRKLTVASPLLNETVVTLYMSCRKHIAITWFDEWTVSSSIIAELKLGVNYVRCSKIRITVIKPTWDYTLFYKLVFWLRNRRMFRLLFKWCILVGRSRSAVCYRFMSQPFAVPFKKTFVAEFRSLWGSFFVFLCVNLEWEKVVVR